MMAEADDVDWIDAGPNVPRENPPEPGPADDAFGSPPAIEEAEPPQPQDLAAKWRDLARYAAACIDIALDCGASEAHAILIEAVTVLDAGIDELDRTAAAT